MPNYPPLFVYAFVLPCELDVSPGRSADIAGIITPNSAYWALPSISGKAELFRQAHLKKGIIPATYFTALLSNKTSWLLARSFTFIVRRRDASSSTVISISFGGVLNAR